MNFDKLPFDMFATKNKEKSSEKDCRDENVKLPFDMFAIEGRPEEENDRNGNVKLPTNTLLPQTENGDDAETVMTGEHSKDYIHQSAQTKHELSDTEQEDMEESGHDGFDNNVSRMSLDEIKSQLEHFTRSIKKVESEQRDPAQDEHTEHPEIYRIPRGLLRELKSFVGDISCIDESTDENEENTDVPDTPDGQPEAVIGIVTEMQAAVSAPQESEEETITPEILSDKQEYNGTELPAFMPDKYSAEKADNEQAVPKSDEIENVNAVTDPLKENISFPVMSIDTAEDDPDIPLIQASVEDFSEPMKTQLKLHLETFADNHRGIRCLLASTADGFEIASYQSFPHDFHVRKLSALTSSLSGISSAMLREVGPGEQDVVFIESNSNIILFKRLTVNSKEICLMAVTTKDESVGQFFWHIKNLSEDVSDILNSH